MSTPSKSDAASNIITQLADFDASAQRGGSIIVVDFGRTGNSAAYRTHGWSGQEASYVWSIQGSSGVQLPNPFDRHSIVIDFDISVCVVGGFLSTSVIELDVNGHPVGSAWVKGLSRVRFCVPKEVIAAGKPIDLMIRHPCFVRLDYLGISNDDRALALCVYGIRAYPPWMLVEMERFAPRPATSTHVDAVFLGDQLYQSQVDTSIYRFGAGEPGVQALREGWTHDRDHNAWCSKRFNYIEIPAPARIGRYVVCISICALYIRNMLVRQRLSVILNGAVIGQFSTAADTVLTIPIPPELLLGATLLRFALVAPSGLAVSEFSAQKPLTFLSFVVDSIEIKSAPQIPGRPTSRRGDDVEVAAALATSEMFLDDSLSELPGVIEQRVGISVRDLLANFESLGDNCFFGGLQRRVGTEVLGLLRFGNTPIRALLRALADNFEAVRDKAMIDMRVQTFGPREWLLHVDRYGLRWHTDVLEDTVDREAVLTQHATRLSYLVRKFRETLRSGRKIFILARADLREQAHPVPLIDEASVIRTPREPYRLAEVLTVFQEINRHGKNSILYVTECKGNQRPGSVELVLPGIMRGYVESLQLSPELSDREYESWLRVAANAWLLNKHLKVISKP